MLALLSVFNCHVCMYKATARVSFIPVYMGNISQVVPAFVYFF